MVNKKIGTLLLTGMMVMSMGTSAFAADVHTITGTPGNSAKVSVTKDLEFAEGITIPSTAFSFKAELKPESPDAPGATISKISYSNADDKGALNTVGKYVVSKNSEINFEKFPHAGEYLYTVSEETGNVEGMSYSTTTYTLRVYVVNDDNGNLYVKNITAQEDGTENKPEKVLFTNTYTKRGGEDSGENSDSLVIRKETKGELADKTKKFKFDVYFKKAATTPATDKELIGKIGQDTITFKYGETTRVELSDEQELRFAEIPAGTRYTVTEVGEVDDYTPSVKVIENGNEQKERGAGDGDDLCSAENNSTNLIGENENKVTFVNTYKNLVVTGIIAKNAPLILVAGLGVVALLGYSLLKRKFVKR